MRIVAAPNALKGSLTAVEASEAISRGARRALGESAEIVLAPVSDGGDGLIDVIEEALREDLGAERRRSRVSGPLGSPVEAEWLISSDGEIAVVEMATASGMALLSPQELDPMRASTLGTGELVAEALQAGARRVMVGLGGSATVDCGTGAANALGIRFMDAEGVEFPPCGGSLVKIARVDTSDLVAPLASGAARVAAIFDASNPLLGPSGAARVYAPQKGASPEEVDLLEAGMRNIADVIERDFGIDARNMPGAGAAGGLGTGLVAFAGAKLSPGAEAVFGIIGLEEKMRGADLVVTAEGRLDAQSAHGKAPAAVARLAKRLGIPCIVLAGDVSTSEEELAALGIAKAYSIRPDGMPLADSMRRSRELMQSAMERALGS